MYRSSTKENCLGFKWNVLMLIRRRKNRFLKHWRKRPAKTMFYRPKISSKLVKQMDQYKCYVKAFPEYEEKQKNRQQQIQIAIVSMWNRSLNAHFHTPPIERERDEKQWHISMGNRKQPVLFIPCLSNTQWWRELVAVYKRYALVFLFRFLHLVLRPLACCIRNIFVYVFLGWR